MPDGFAISFNENNPEEAVISGSIHGSDWREAFESKTDKFSRLQYEAQWRGAISIALGERRATCLITNLEVDDAGNGWINYYSLIPTEDAKGAPARYHGSGDGFFITESISFITLHTSNLETRRFLDVPDGLPKLEVAVYYFEIGSPDRFFPYLRDSICDVWSKFVSTSSLVQCLEEISAP